MRKRIKFTFIPSQPCPSRGLRFRFRFLRPKIESGCFEEVGRGGNGRWSRFLRKILVLLLLLSLRWSEKHSVFALLVFRHRVSSMIFVIKRRLIKSVMFHCHFFPTESVGNSISVLVHLVGISPSWSVSLLSDYIGLVLEVGSRNSNRVRGKTMTFEFLMDTANLLWHFPTKSKLYNITFSICIAINP